MTTTPFEPNSQSGDEGVPAADPGQGAPNPAPGFGVEGEEPAQPEFPHPDDQPMEPSD
ncbi:hypothetical protein [Actinophytocola xanthii]|uniref:hypothetical protein n=1 Tax=Actinophytocola xanthii TaxID=1912961 RepID=UPI00130183E1|nr:hypothetical protein [Actinophytocola xanthii]